MTVIFGRFLVYVKSFRGHSFIVDCLHVVARGQKSNMSGPHSNSETSESAWMYPNAGNTSGGLRVADTLDEVKTFAYECFDKLDKDSDGFISKGELSEALAGDMYKWREKSFICFMLRRIADIAESYDEEWDCKEGDGISRADIQEYFRMLRKRIAQS